MRSAQVLMRRGRGQQADGAAAAEARTRGYVVCRVLSCCLVCGEPVRRRAMQACRSGAEYGSRAWLARELRCGTRATDGCVGGGGSVRWSKIPGAGGRRSLAWPCPSLVPDRLRLYDAAGNKQNCTLDACLGKNIYGDGRCTGTRGRLGQIKTPRNCPRGAVNAEAPIQALVTWTRPSWKVRLSRC